MVREVRKFIEFYKKVYLDFQKYKFEKILYIPRTGWGGISGIFTYYSFFTKIFSCKILYGGSINIREKDNKFSFNNNFLKNISCKILYGGSINIREKSYLTI